MSIQMICPSQGGEVSEPDKKAPANNKAEYDAPRIEEVVTAADIEREAQYAGSFISQQRF